MEASAVYHSGSEYGAAWGARLNHVVITSFNYPDWNPGIYNVSQWIQVDFIITHLIQAIGMQGAPAPASTGWLTNYTLKYSDEGIEGTWTDYVDATDTTVVMLLLMVFPLEISGGFVHTFF